MMVPYWLAYPASFFTPWYYRLTGKRPRFTRMSLKMLHDGRRVRHDHATAELDYRPRPPGEGIRAAVEWFHEAGQLNPVFRSRRDPGVLALVGFVLLVCGIGGAGLLIGGSGWDRLLGVLGMAVSAVYLWLTCPVLYEVTRTHLNVRGGPFRWKIPLSDIEEVYTTRLPLSAPAWSWKRLRVNYKKNKKSHFVLISPMDQDRFLKAVTAAEPGLTRRGDSLDRTPPLPESE
jgi:hypothetical protein